MPSVLEQFRIADFLDWYKKKVLVLNPDFQRRSVWTPSAKIFLIDTILRRLPIPKIFMRTTIDIRTKRTMREVVDGQQRLLAILDFAEDGLILSSRAGEFKGLRYSTLPDELKEAFLTYPIAVEQLINASNSDVLEIFARLNWYNVPLNAAELRHAEYSGEFKWAVHDAAKRWDVLWEKFQVVKTRQRLRMMDDALMAEMWGVVLHGLDDGDDRRLRELYKTHDAEFPEQDTARAKVDETLSFVVDNLADAIHGAIANPPHFLMLFSAVAHALHGIPPGRMADAMPARDATWLQNVEVARANLRDQRRSSAMRAAVSTPSACGPGLRSLARS